MAQISIKRSELLSFIEREYKLSQYDDYGPNGLQIEGDEDITSIAFAVSSDLNSIEQAVTDQTSALIVHHGLFWKFHGSKTLTGPFYKRVAALIKNNINLIGIHLPMDGHQTWGHAACIAAALQLKEIQEFGLHKKMPTGVWGKLEPKISASDLKSKLENFLQHKTILASSNPDELISSLGIITGGANSKWSECLPLNIDAYLTGEMSEHDWHDSQEAGIHMLAGGHHATEVFGVKMLMQKIEQKFKVPCTFIDSPNQA